MIRTSLPTLLWTAKNERVSRGATKRSEQPEERGTGRAARNARRLRRNWQAVSATWKLGRSAGADSPMDRERMCVIAVLRCLLLALFVLRCAIARLFFLCFAHARKKPAVISCGCRVELLLGKRSVTLCCPSLSASLQSRLLVQEAERMARSGCGPRLCCFQPQIALSPADDPQTRRFGCGAGCRCVYDVHVHLLVLTLAEMQTLRRRSDKHRPEAQACVLQQKDWPKTTR